MAITASHNPAVYNGIKVFMEGGRDADETLTAAFEGYIRELEGEPVETVPYEEGLAAGSIQLIDPMNDYIDSILKMVDAEAIRSRGPARGAGPHVRRVQDGAADHLAHHPVRRRGHP